MLKITELKPGTFIELNGQPFEVISASHQVLGRGYGMTTAKLKNLLTGTQSERVFRRNELIKEAEMEKRKANFLWRDKNNFYFLEQETQQRFAIPASLVGFSGNFLVKGVEVEIVFFSEEPILVNLPIKLTLKVKEAEPGLRGGRETPGTKRVILETGYTIQAPLFIKEGDVIIVDTRTGKYLGRAG